MLQVPRIALARFRVLVRSDRAGIRAGFIALLVSSFGSLLAGLTLGSITGTLERLPGLLVLVPAAIGMRGNIFGAMGSRLGTAIRLGTFKMSRRRDTLVGQNLAASFLLSIAVSLFLAVVARTVSIAFGLEDTISVAELVVISVVAGVISSVVVMGITVAVAGWSARRDWDLDNVAAPIVTAAGDVVTLPSLFLAAYLIDIDWVTPILATACVVSGVVALGVGIKTRRTITRRIVRESIGILAIAGIVDVVAGLAIEKRMASFVAFPALLVLIPPFLEDSGSLGGILSARISTKLHLGMIDPRRAPIRDMAEDIALIFAYGFPIFLLDGAAAFVAASIAGLASPGAATMIAVALLAGFVATCAAVVIAAFGAITVFRLGQDPDTYGIPIVTSSLDLVGTVALILALVVLGLT